MKFEYIFYTYLVDMVLSSRIVTNAAEPPCKNVIARACVVSIVEANFEVGGNGANKFIHFGDK